MKDMLSPKSHTLLTPGEGYIGGKLYFGRGENHDLFRGKLIQQIPNEEVFHKTKNPLDRMPKSLKDALLMHILAVAIVVKYLRRDGVGYLSMMVHPATEKKYNSKFKKWRLQLKKVRRNLLKRDAARLKRKLSHLQTYLGGIKYMTAIPDIVIIIDQHKEYTALRECIILGIPTICLIDTNCDPDLVDFPIPANDDTRASVRFILTKLVFAICEGRSSDKIKS